MSAGICKYSLCFVKILLTWGGKIEAENAVKMPTNAIFPTNYENPQVENYKCPLLLYKTAGIVLLPQFVNVVLGAYINS